MGDRPGEAKTTPKEQSDPYTVEPFPPMRRWAVENGWLNRRRHIIHALMEMDVTLPRQRIADYRQQTGESISFTAFLIRCLALAVSENPAVSAWKDWRGRLVTFHKVNISTMVEVEMEGKKVGMFGQGGGWGIPAPTFPLTVTVGGIVRKPGLVEERIEPRQYLDITLSFDHDITDGQPAARFTQRFRQLIEGGFGLDELPAPEETGRGEENQ